MIAPTTRLRQAMNCGEMLPFIGVYDVFSATVAARHFNGLFLSGFSFAASHYGLPDVGFIAWRDIVDLVGRIRAVLPEPHLVVDIDDGYVDADTAAHVVRLLEDAGASAVVLEDQARPRMCGHFTGKRLLDLDSYLQKLDRVLGARRKDMVVIARTDACEDAERIERVKAFAAAGADAVLADGLRSFESIRAVARAVDKPIMFNQIAGGLSPRCTLSQLRELGVRLVNYSTPCLFAAQEAIDRSMRQIIAADGMLPDTSTGDHVGVKACTTLMQENMHRSIGAQPMPPAAIASEQQPQKVIKPTQPQHAGADVASRMERLSPAQRQLLEQRLKQNANDAADESGRIARVDRSAPLPASYAQARMWFLDRLYPNDPSYNSGNLISLRGEVDVAALKQAVARIVQRQEALRTGFIEHEGEPLQRIEPSVDLPVAVVDLTHLSEQAAQEERTRLASEMHHTPFDLRTPPLCRFAIVRISPRRVDLVCVTHHIVSDRWSLQLFASELTALYDAFRSGRMGALPELSVQYADYAAWQRSEMSGDALASKLAPWRSMLTPLPPPLDLPFAQARPPVQTMNGACHVEYLPLDLHERSQALAGAMGMTRFTLYLSAWFTLLWRYTRQSRLIVGVPVAGRNHADVEKIQGLFVNTLPVPAQIDGTMSFEQLARQVRVTMVQCLSAQEVPFEKLVHELKLPRDRSRSPLVTVMLNYHNVPLETPSPQGIEMQISDLENIAAKCDLTLTLRLEPQGLLAEYSFNTDLFDREIIEQVAAHYRTLLQAAVSSPQSSLEELTISIVMPGTTVAASPLPQQLAADSTVAAMTQADSSARLHELVERQAAAAPDAIAVIAGDIALTYRDLNDRAQVLAARLRKLGVGPDALVGLYMKRGVDMVVGLLAVLKAGGAYVPLEPSYPRQRLAGMMADARLRIVLTQPALADDLPAAVEHALTLSAQGEIISPDESQPEPAAASSSTPTPAAAPHHLAYVLFTSGSTGRPKGVMIEHRAIVNHMLWMNERFPLTTGDRVLQKTPISFDASVWEFWAPLMAGATLVMAQPEAHRDPAALVREVMQHGITTLQLVPSVMAAMLDSPGLRSCLTLSRVFAGGEALTSAVVNRFFEQCEAQLINLYGPTEAAIDATYHVCIKGDAGAATAPIGKPIHGMRARVLDEAMRPVEPGEIGELFLGGRGLARGYLHQPEMTADRFVPDPFADSPGERLYRTGDRVRVLSDGALEFVGRVDHQVKLRGMRIELGEIEALLAGHSSVRQAAAVVREDRLGDQRLIAYIVPAHGAAVDEAHLRDHLSQHLPAAVVPAAIVVLDAMPQLANGKIDRAALPEPLTPSATAPGQGPRDEVEQTIHEIWCAALGTTTAGIHDDFFTSGGHSLLAIRVLSQIRDRLRAEVSVSRLFDAPTIAGLAAAVKEGRSQPTAQATPIRRVARSLT